MRDRNFDIKRYLTLAAGGAAALTGVLVGCGYPENPVSPTSMQAIDDDSESQGTIRRRIGDIKMEQTGQVLVFDTPHKRMTDQAQGVLAEVCGAYGKPKDQPDSRRVLYVEVPGCVKSEVVKRELRTKVLFGSK